MSDLKEVLGETPDEETTVVEEQPQPDAEKVEEAVEQPEQPEVPAEPEPAKEEPQTVPLAALHEERQKRQELERRLQRVEQAQPKPEPEPAPDVFEDPEGYTKHVDGQVEQRVRTARLDMSEDMARMNYGDDKVNAALEAIEAHAGSPTHRAILENRNPYKALVEWHQQQTTAAEIGDPAKWMEEQRAKIKAELEAEFAVKQTRETPPAPSLANQANLGARKGPEWSGPKPLDEILTDR